MSSPISVRFLKPEDLPQLLRLEARQWEDHQAADEAALLARMAAHPELCVGAFCARSGEALASLFMRPTCSLSMRYARRWADCAAGRSMPREPQRGDALFGISLTSVDGDAVDALVAFFWPHALKGGWREIYLGSPMPGFKRAREADPALDAEHYARTLRGGLPRDPQLRYYHRRGFTQIVSVAPGYFPHEASLDHGAVLCGHVPLASLGSLWRRLPLGWIVALTGRLGAAAERPAPRPRPARKPSWSFARRGA